MPVEPSPISIYTMNRLGVIGLSWRHSSSEDLTRFALPEEQRGEWMESIATDAGLQEIVYLNTCSRIEVYFRTKEDACYGDLRRQVFKRLTGRASQAGEAERTLRAWNGEGAAEHLLMVVTGLDSAQVGETEVLGQFRRALSLSEERGLAAGTLGIVGTEALKIARRVRQKTGIETGKTSLAEIALDLVTDQDLLKAAPVALVGVSPMTIRCAEGLAAQGRSIIWVNRTHAKAAAALLSSGADGEAMDLATFAERLPKIGSVVLATGAPGTVLSAETLQGLSSQEGPGPLIVDLAVPADVDPKEAEQAGLHRIGMDRILAKAERSSRTRSENAIEARVAIDDALDRLKDSCGTGAIGRMARAVQEHYSLTAATSFESLCKKDLAGLSPAHQDCLHDWSQKLAKQMAHMPTSGLRQVVRDQGLGALDSFLAHAQPELVRSIREALTDSPKPESEGDSQ